MRIELFEQILDCKECEIATELKAFHRGSTSPDIVFIGEAAGAKEIKLGKPFVGPSGKKLDKWISNNVTKEYAITNVVRCKPPNNGKPKDQEIKNCRKWLERQMQMYNPNIIIPLGKTAFESAIAPLDKKKKYLEHTFRIYTEHSFNNKAIAFPIPHPRWYISHGRDIPDLDENMRKALHL